MMNSFGMIKNNRYIKKWCNVHLFSITKTKIHLCQRLIKVIVFLTTKTTISQKFAQIYKEIYLNLEVLIKFAIVYIIFIGFYFDIILNLQRRFFLSLLY